MSKVFIVLVVLLIIPVSSFAETVHVSKTWLNNNFQEDGSGYRIDAYFQATVPSAMSPGQMGNVIGFASKTGGGPGYSSLVPKGGHECPMGGCANFPGNFLFTNGDYGPGSTVRSFTAPTTPGMYQMGFFAYFDRDPLDVGWCVDAVGNPSSACTTPFSYGSVAVVVVQGTQCNDGINNDNAEGADTLDPQCHTDCNVNNPGSYVPTHNSESTPPNGTCPASASLNLNGRAAFLQVVKNFFAFITAKAFAGE